MKQFVAMGRDALLKLFDNFNSTRCEKASSYMLKEGFNEVYHLKGGILKYLEEVPAEESLWEGHCFVFDHRVSVGHGLSITGDKICFACRTPLSQDAQLDSRYEEGVQCQYCCDVIAEEVKRANKERQLQVALADERHEVHIGMMEAVVKQKRSRRRKDANDMSC